MNGTTGRSPHSGKRSVHYPRLLSAAFVAYLLATVGLVLGACGGSGPGVAALGSTTSTTGASSVSGQAQLDMFGACMRSHGLPEFPNPIKNGNTVTLSRPNSPLYPRAEAACRELLPGSLGSFGTITSADEADYLKAVSCMHAYGFPQMPDPTFSGGTVHLVLPSIDKHSTLFEKAFGTCRKLIPAGLPYSD